MQNCIKAITSTASYTVNVPEIGKVRIILDRDKTKTLMPVQNIKFEINIQAIKNNSQYMDVKNAANLLF
jgi:hypothetical protein